MNRHISFYDPHKSYEKESIYWPKESDVLDLTQVGDGNIGFIADIASRFDVINPVFFVVRNRGIIRMNRTTYVEVRIPDSLTARVRHCSSIEFTLSSPENTYETYRATVEHLLRFPDFLIRTMPPKEPPDIDPDELERPLKENEAEKMPYTPPRAVFEEWIGRHGGEIVFESPNGYVLAHDGHNLLLVSFFDGSGSTWLADEEMLDGGPPLWFSESAHVVSPLYRLSLAAKHFNGLEYCKVLPLTIISDHIEVINEEEMIREWCRMGVLVCYCHKQDEYVDTFENLLESISMMDNMDYRVPSTEKMDALKQEIMRYDKEHK